jgi:hypothetical protein
MVQRQDLRRLADIPRAPATRGGDGSMLLSHVLDRHRTPEPFTQRLFDGNAD